ncbi:MAG: hypothetical protein EXX96DRAFT_608131 [Benjaminiella poitrasii]|nr:MAG: hypothetical protein EXX96DRAFT_608131 [Benjaminiella poitrasii]
MKVNFRSCLVLSFALLKAKVFWLYSAICCCLFSKEPALISSRRNMTICNTQHKIKAAAAEEEGQLQQLSSTCDLLQTENIEKSVCQLLDPVVSAVDLPSLDRPSIRTRPTLLDERQGTTCPPIWWQKARIKLKRTPQLKVLPVLTNQVPLKRANKTYPSLSSVLYTPSISMLPSTSSITRHFRSPSISKKIPFVRPSTNIPTPSLSLKQQEEKAQQYYVAKLQYQMYMM